MGTSCGLRPTPGTSTSPSTTNTNPTNPNPNASSNPNNSNGSNNAGQAGPKCSDIADTSVATNCTSAKGSSGQLLGCRVNKHTKKCVENLWEYAVQRGECEMITVTGGCWTGVQIAEVSGTNLKTIGLCRIKAGTNKCEEAPVGYAEVHAHKYCLPHETKTELKQIADELCATYKANSGGAVVGRTTLKESCDRVFLSHGFSTGTTTSGICLSQQHENICIGYLSHDNIVNIQKGSSYVDPIKSFCAGLIKREKKARPDFSGLYDQEDDSACEQTAISTEADAYTGQVDYKGSRRDVCRKSGTSS